MLYHGNGVKVRLSGGMFARCTARRRDQPDGHTMCCSNISSWQSAAECL